MGVFIIIIIIIMIVSDELVIRCVVLHVSEYNQIERREYSLTVRFYNAPEDLPQKAAAAIEGGLLKTGTCEIPTLQ